LEVRREGYYEWKKRPNREEKERELLSILKTKREENPEYGTQSLIDTLPENKKCSYGKTYKLIKKNDLLCYRKKKPHGNTKSDPKAKKAEDLVERNFYAEKPGIKWFTDITEEMCLDGKLYICEIMDAFEGAIVGHSMDNNMRTPLCTTALLDAQRRFGHAGECIIHSDHGSQFTSNLYREICEKNGFKQSMGAVGTCADNTRIESFHATLKKELLYKIPCSKMTREEVKHLVFEWIETRYNRTRRHTPTKIIFLRS
jgi:transposase InsO family protein